MNKSPLTVLIIRFSSLGDVVLQTPILTKIKKRFGENVSIHFLTSEEFAPLITGHRDIAHVHGFSRKKSLKELSYFVKNIIKKYQIDLFIDLHGTIRSLFLRWRFYYIPRIWVDKRTIERWILCTLKIDLLSWQRSRDFEREKTVGESVFFRTINDYARFFDWGLSCKEGDPQIEKGKTDGFQYGSDYYTSLGYTFQSKVEDQAQLFKLLERLSSQKTNLTDSILGRGDENLSPYLVIVPSASFEEKRWPYKKFFTLIQKILNHQQYANYKVLLLAGPLDDFCKAFDVLEKDYEGRFFNLQGLTSLQESALILKHGRFCIGNDTGLPHLSEALGRPAVFILGPTGQEFGFSPHHSASEMAYVNIWCRPCTTNGKGRCIRAQRFCLEDITVETVFEKSNQIYTKLEKLNGENNLFDLKKTQFDSGSRV